MCSNSCFPHRRWSPFTTILVTSIYLVLFPLFKGPYFSFASLSILTRVSFSAFLFLLTIATSSAYAKICVLYVPIHPVIFIFWKIASKTRSNNVGESASLCLTKLVMGKAGVYWLSTLTVAIDPAMVTLMSWTNF